MCGSTAPNGPASIPCNNEQAPRQARVALGSGVYTVVVRNQIVERAPTVAPPLERSAEDMGPAPRTARVVWWPQILRKRQQGKDVRPEEWCWWYLQTVHRAGGIIDKDHGPSRAFLILLVTMCNPTSSLWPMWAKKGDDRRPCPGLFLCAVVRRSILWLCCQVPTLGGPRLQHDIRYPTKHAYSSLVQDIRPDVSACLEGGSGARSPAQGGAAGADGRDRWGGEGAYCCGAVWARVGPGVGHRLGSMWRQGESNLVGISFKPH